MRPNHSRDSRRPGIPTSKAFGVAACSPAGRVADWPKEILGDLFVLERDRMCVGGRARLIAGANHADACVARAMPLLDLGFYGAEQLIALGSRAAIGTVRLKIAFAEQNESAGMRLAHRGNERRVCVNELFLVHRAGIQIGAVVDYDHVRRILRVVPSRGRSYSN